MKHVLATTFAIALSATASLAATFSGQTSGKFTGLDNENWTVDIVDSSQGDDTQLTWGKYPTSTLTIMDFSFSEVLVEGANKVQIGLLKWYNASTLTWLNDSAFRAFANLCLNITSPSVLAAIDSVKFDVTNTLNVHGGTADLIVGKSFGDYNLVLPYDLGDGVKLTGFSFEVGEVGSLDDLTNSYDKIKWTNPEGGKSYLKIYADVHQTVAPVPLPAAGVLLLGAVGGLASLRSRKRS